MTIEFCACLGPMYGDPYCYCEMKIKGLEPEKNPLRIAENERSVESLKRLFGPGGKYFREVKEDENNLQTR